MKACFPVAKDHGLESHVHPHFGSAPMFLVVDTETREVRAVVNGACEHAHGQCQPLAGLAGAEIDAVVVGGIGPGALDRLRRADVVVYWAPRGTVREVLEGIRSGSVEPVALESGLVHGIGCAGHGGGGHAAPHGGQHRHRHGLR